MGLPAARPAAAGRAAPGRARDRRRHPHRHRDDHRPGHGHRPHRPGRAGRASSSRASTATSARRSSSARSARSPWPSWPTWPWPAPPACSTPWSREAMSFLGRGRRVVHHRRALAGRLRRAPPPDRARPDVGWPPWLAALVIGLPARHLARAPGPGRGAGHQPVQRGPGHPVAAPSSPSPSRPSGCAGGRASAPGRRSSPWWPWPCRRW